MARKKSNNNFVEDGHREGWAFFEKTNTWRRTPSPSGASPDYFPKEWGEWVAVSRTKGWLPDEDTRLNLGSSLHAATNETGEAGGGGMKIGAGHKPQPYGWHGWYGANNEERRLKEKQYNPTRLVRRAREHLGSTKWAPKDRLTGKDYYCNAFVGEMLEAEGVKVPHIGGRIGDVLGAEQSVTIHEATGGLLGGQYPSAEQWTKPMKGFEIVKDPRPGDIASNGDHVAIVSGDGTTISASSDTGTVVENDWGFRAHQIKKVVFQRPTLK